jgi:hypothetical protein
MAQRTKPGTMPCLVVRAEPGDAGVRLGSGRSRRAGRSGAFAAVAASEPRIGEVLGSYRLARLLGQGGHGYVYLAEHVHLARCAAVKILAPALVGDRVVMRRFVTEARVLSEIDSPGVVQVVDVIERRPPAHRLRHGVRGGADASTGAEAGPVRAEAGGQPGPAAGGGAGRDPRGGGGPPGPEAHQHPARAAKPAPAPPTKPPTAPPASRASCAEGGARGPPAEPSVAGARAPFGGRWRARAVL